MKRIAVAFCICFLFLLCGCFGDEGTAIMPTLIVSSPESTDPIAESTPSVTPGAVDNTPAENTNEIDVDAPTPTGTHVCSYDEWRVVVDSTAQFTGIKERVCVYCGNKQIEEIPVKVLDDDEKLKLAKNVAEGIARSVPQDGTDLERLSKAARLVYNYCLSCYYTTSGSDHCTAYGVFIKGEYSCEGAVRALGLVLDYMGYEWEHVNAGTAFHQWCAVNMDGKAGYVDGFMGSAGYGKHPLA